MTTKHLSFIITAAMLLVSSSLHAEQYNDAPKSEISVSYGGGSASSIIDDFENVIGNIIYSAFGTDIAYTNRKSIGVINVDYNYHLKPWIALGINCSYSYTDGDIMGKVEGTKQKTGDIKDSYYTVMPTVKFDWLRRQHFSMYSRISAGAVYRHSVSETTTGTSYSENNNKTMFMMQVSPIAVEAGSDNLRAFGELGFGQAGILQLGLRYRF